MKALRSVLAVAVICALVLTNIIVVLAGDEQVPVSWLQEPFSVEPINGGNLIPNGSIINHLQNGETSVISPAGKTIYKTSNSRSALVPTPYGLQRASEVYNVPSGSRIETCGETTRIFYDEELILTIVNHRNTNLGKPEYREEVPSYSGWLEYSEDWTVANLDWFQAHWTVPSAPPDPGGNVVDFLFNGIEPDDGTEIIQPVLEWNNAGSGRWTIAAWSVGNQGNIRGTVRNVNEGDSLYGTMMWVWEYSTWFIQITDSDTGQYSALYSNEFGESDLAVFCALETYNINGDEDVPGDTTFHNMSLEYLYSTVDITWHEVEAIPGGSNLTYLNVQVYSDSKVKLHTAN
ncbi:MAG: hypothetical protein SVP26_11420 [Chloroflexota bacterium]|nr:hypothetical protein [Chloroflexota bacterium]